MISATQSRRRRGARAEVWGRATEDQAAQWYEARGGAIVARRARTAFAEIDLVVRMADTMVFVEVRGRRSIADALASVSRERWARIGDGAEAYAAQHLAEGCDIRIDLAAFGRDGRMEIVENAPLSGAL